MDEQQLAKVLAIPVAILLSGGFGWLMGYSSPFFSSRGRIDVSQSSLQPPGDSATKNSNDELEDKLRCCQEETVWDQQQLPRLLESAARSRAVLFGIDHGEADATGDKRDGEFVAGLLPPFKEKGYRYVAVECPPSLNTYRTSLLFEQEAKKTFRGHWVEFGPVVMKARKLGMKLLFYDVDIDWRGSYQEREQIAFDRIKSEIFDKDALARIIGYAGIKHIYKQDVEKSWLEPEKIKPLGAFLNEYLEGKLTTVLLQPENHHKLGFLFDFSFYVGKRCPQ